MTSVVEFDTTDGSLAVACDRVTDWLTYGANRHVERAAQNQRATSAPRRIYATSGTRPS